MYEYPPLRSLDEDRIRTFVRFLNLTGKKVDIVWVNFDGRYVRYQSLENKQFVDINTYKYHPWIAFDSDTKDKMHLDKKFVYEPQTTKEFFDERYPNQRYGSIRETRIVVKITLPVYSLRYASLLSAKNLFREPKDVDSLDLPKSLIEDLKKVIKTRNSLNAMSLLSRA